MAPFAALEREPGTYKPSSGRKRELTRSVSHPVAEILLLGSELVFFKTPTAAAFAKMSMQVFQCCVREMVLAIFL